VAEGRRSRAWAPLTTVAGVLYRFSGMSPQVVRDCSFLLPGERVRRSGARGDAGGPRGRILVLPLTPGTRFLAAASSAEFHQMEAARMDLRPPRAFLGLESRAATTAARPFDGPRSE
jgi:hypothetical protein